MANKYYLDQEGLERLVQYINDALSGKADSGDIPADVALKSDLQDYMRVDAMGTYIDESELSAELADVVRDADLSNYATNASLSDVVREADLEDYATNDDLDDLRTSLATVYHYRGSVADLEALEAIENPEVGDVYNIADTGMNAGWTGSNWDYFGSVVDLTDYLTEDEVNEIPIPVVDSILYGGKSAVVSDADGIAAMVANDEPVVEVKLSDDVVVTEAIDVPAGKSVSIDLGGNKLSAPSRVVNVDGGSLTLSNGDVEAAGYSVVVLSGDLVLDGANVTSTNNVAISATGAGSSVVMNSGKVSAQESGILVTTGASLELNGGEIECTDNCPIQGNGTAGQGDINVVMNGGKLVAHITSAGYQACAVYMPNSGTFTMNGGEIVSDGAGVVMRAGEVNLNGGSIVANGASGVKGKVGDSKVTVGPYAVVYDESANYPAKATLELNIGANMVLQGTDGDIDVLLSSGASANINDLRA